MTQSKERVMGEEGLYRSSFEHDNCGIGAVVNIKGVKSHATVENALKIVENLEHRAGKDAEGKTGDGVGIMLQISHKFFKKVTKPLGFDIGGEREYGVGMFFMPQDELKRNREMKMFEIIAQKEGLEFLGWREVPVHPEVLGTKALECMPHIMQCFIKKPEEVEKGYITGYITEIEEATGIWQPQLTQAGYQLCNGVYAVAYCRNRYTTGMDMGRTSRQREVIDKMLQQAKVASPSALLTAVRYACPNINTTLSNDELFALAADVNSYSITDTEGFPYTYDLTLGTLGVFGVKDSLVCTDLAGDVKKLHTYLFGDDGYEPSRTVKDISYTIQKAFGVGQ